MPHDGAVGRNRRGSVSYDRTNRCWWARVSLGTVDGKRVVRKARAATKEAAQDELVKLLRLYGAGGEPARQTLSAYLDDWLASHGPSVRASTRVSYAGHITNHIAPLLGGIMVGKLRPADVRRLIADRSAAGLSPATVGRIIATLHIALQQAVDDRAIVDNPADGVRLPRVEPKAVAALTPAGAEAIIGACSGPYAYLEPLVVVLLGSGMRLGEAVGLDWGDVRLDGSFVLVRRTKTRIRSVSISDDAVTALRDHKRAAVRVGDAEPVFLSPRPPHHRLAGATVSHALPRALEAAGLPRLSPHGLRHGSASIMVAAGVHMRVVAEQLGHRNPALTAKVYAHVLPESQRDAVQALNRRRKA